MQRNREIQVGLTVLISVVVLTAGLLWLKQVRVGGGFAEYDVDFATVGGLKVQDRVQVLGIKRGSVAGFRQMDDYVRVTIKLDADVTLNEGAVINLTTMGIVGEKLMEIDPGEGTPVQPGHVFTGRNDPDMAMLTTAGADALEDAKALNADLRALIADLRREARIDSTLEAARGAMANVRETSGRLGPDLEALTAELRETVAQLNAAFGGPDSSLAGAIDNAGRAAASADHLTGELADAAGALTRIVTQLEAGEGTAGMLLRDHTLHAQAETTIVMIQDLVEDIKKRPKRYFHFSLF